MSDIGERVMVHLHPLGKRLWDALKFKDKSYVINRLITFGLETPKGQQLICEHTSLAVDTSNGVTALISKENNID